MNEKKILNTVLGFDFGTKNIGVAVGQSVTKTATALSSLSVRDGIPIWSEIEKLISEWDPDAVIVGNPLHMDGTESEMSARARKRLYGRYNLLFLQADERLTSFEAKEWANRLGHKGHYGSNPVDSMAAQILLEAWMNDPKNRGWFRDSACIA